MTDVNEGLLTSAHMECTLFSPRIDLAERNYPSRDSRWVAPTRLALEKNTVE